MRPTPAFNPYPWFVPLLILVLTSIACAGQTGGGEDEPDDSETPRAGAACSQIQVGPRSRHGRPTRPASLSEGLTRRLCSVSVRATATGGTARIGDRDYSFRLTEAPLVQLPAIVDSNSPAFWQEDQLHVFNSGWQDTYKSSGGAVENLAEPLRVQLPAPARPGTVWMEAVWQDPTNNVLYGWYHFEPGDIACQTAPMIGAAVSFDGGTTWEDRGFVLTNGNGIDCGFANGYFVGGNGDFSVVLGPEGRYFFFIYSNYIGPADEVGVAVARSSFELRGQPGTAIKYYNGAWSEPGIGGHVSAIFQSSTGWKGPVIEAFWGPSVHWNSYLGGYVALLNHTNGANWIQEGIYISFSRDLLNWSRPQKILESNDWYPQVLGLGVRGTDSLAGRTSRVFVGGLSNFILEFN